MKTSGLQSIDEIVFNFGFKIMDHLSSLLNDYDIIHQKCVFDSFVFGNSLFEHYISSSHFSIYILNNDNLVIYNLNNDNLVIYNNQPNTLGNIVPLSDPLCFDKIIEKAIELYRK